MASLNNSGIKEMSSSNVGRSYAGSGGKDGLGGFSYGASIELKDPVITFEDMRQEVKDYCFKLAEDSIRNNLTPFKAQAEYIKKHLDAKFGGSWHVIVGNSFSSYMTYEDSSVILFWLNQWGFLIFKYG